MSLPAGPSDAPRDVLRRDPASSDSKIVAVLGPTNTGKTHLAIERMLGHRTGMIGFPLRLLARENYDRVRAIKGDGAVALVTGEEKIVPPRACYFFCTVESMPLEREVGFLAIDEIQLCADRERGHIFTDRLLHARGRDETMFLGADTMKPVIQRLVPDAEFIARPRFSQLTYAGPKKITRLPPRSATVAFSAADVYGIAELIRRQRGGAAVVMGALSPRTRNAQVAMFQAGEVDYLVATDAIGMGLNMDVNHVAFAGVRKFDGHAMRALLPNELAQIAGRAGRHMNDGTFGTTADVGALEPHVIDAIENHRFPTVKSVYWRARDLNFSSIEALKKSLDAPPQMADLIRKGDADDQLALAQLAGDPEIAALADRPSRLKLLWEVCQVPDFRHALGDAHGRLLSRLFQFLVAPGGRLPVDWVAGQIGRLDRADGDIDTLTARIDHVRTWNYIAQRDGWTEDPRHWQGLARALEDKLSDALHERLTQRFVDRRAAVLVKRLQDPGSLLSSVGADGEVAVEGHYVGQLAGFRFRPDSAVKHPEDRRAARALVHAAGRALRGEIVKRVTDMTQGNTSGEISLDADGRLLWRGEAVADLAPGRDMLAPDVRLLPSDLLDAEQQAALKLKLAEWLAKRMQRDIGPLLKLRAASESDELPGALRGLLFQIMEGLGAAPRDAVAAQLGALDEDGRKKLAQHGVRVGALHLFMPQLFGGRAVKMRALLWKVFHADVPALPPLLLAGQASVALAGEGVAEGATFGVEQLRAVGYMGFGARALRLDQAEKFAYALRTLGRQGPFPPNDELATLAGVTLAELPAMVTTLGIKLLTAADGSVLFSGRSPKARRVMGNKPQNKHESKREPKPESKQMPAEPQAPAESVPSAAEAPAATDGETPAPESAADGALADAAMPDAIAADTLAKKKRRRRRKKKPAAAGTVAALEAVATEAGEAGAAGGGEAGAPVAASEGEAAPADAAGEGVAPAAGDAAKKRKRRRRKKKPEGAAAAVDGAPAAAVDKPKAERPKKVWIIPPMKEGAAADAERKPRPERADGDRPRADRPRSERPNDGKPRGDRPFGDRPRDDRPRGPRREDRGERAPRSYSDPKPRVDPDSPFAKLGELLAAKKAREPSDS
ncbi:MAG: helicase-related protein [Alphaproteobacteria bacterium]